MLLSDEPDAHPGILRQRQTYNLLIQVAEQQGSQIIAASHSEVVLNEATGWVLYLENSTDLAILQTFARVLDHEAQRFLERPFVKYVETNLPRRASDHFHGLREAKDDVLGIAIFDRLDKELQSAGGLVETMSSRRAIENYFCLEDVLLGFARHCLPDDLLGQAEGERREQAMREAIAEVEAALQTLGKPGPWSSDLQATDEFLDPLFKKYFGKLRLPLQLRKSDYHLLRAWCRPFCSTPRSRRSWTRSSAWRNGPGRGRGSGVAGTAPAMGECVRHANDLVERALSVLFPQS